MNDNDPLAAHQADVELVKAKSKLLATLTGLASGVLLVTLAWTVVGIIVVLR